MNTLTALLLAFSISAFTFAAPPTSASASDEQQAKTEAFDAYSAFMNTSASVTSYEAPQLETILSHDSQLELNQSLAEWQGIIESVADAAIFEEILRTVTLDAAKDPEYWFSGEAEGSDLVVTVTSGKEDVANEEDDMMQVD